MIFNMMSGRMKTPVLNASYPANATVTAGTSATFSVAISEDGMPATYTYQWYVNGVAVSGVTGPSYTRSTTSDKGQYTVYCEVTNAAGTVTSRTATLTVNKTPVLSTSYPANATVMIGSSVTCSVSVATAGYPTTYTYQWYKNGTAVSGATSATYTFTPTAVGSNTVYCKVTNAAGTVQSRTATIAANGYLPVFTYTGTYQLVDDNGAAATDSTQNWKILFLTSGTLKFTSLGAASAIDVFLVGAGGGGGLNVNGGGGGGAGGFTKTAKAISVVIGTSYAITIGAGGAAGTSSATAGTDGGTTSAFGLSAAGGGGGKGGSSGSGNSGGAGGDGGSGGGAGGGKSGSTTRYPGANGGSDGADGSATTNTGAGGTGQGITTREFGETGKTLFSGGGAGGNGSGITTVQTGGAGGGGNTGANGTANTGGGGGAKASGGSGIVIIRNKR